METSIYTTKKLEKLVKKKINKEAPEPNGRLGKWNGTVFYVNRRKCWLLTNALTLYNLIITDITAAELNEIERRIILEFHRQLNFDGFEVSLEIVYELIGEIKFYQTDNDRRMTGIQNQKILALEYLKSDYLSLDQMNMDILTHNFNKEPIQFGKKQGNFIRGIYEMAKILK